MKKEGEVKYPNSASLFRFCRRVLDHKYGGIRVIDQDVGQILGFDPADCSHWKKGKKNIRSIQAMKNIAEHLGIDEKLVVDVAAGELNEFEAFFEFSGYGSHFVDQKLIENAKKDYYRKNIGSWSKEKELEFKEQFNPNNPTIDRIVNEIHEKIDLKEAPLYLPEVVSNFPDITLRPIEAGELGDSFPPLVQKIEDNKLMIYYEKGTEIRPYMRYQMAKAMAEYFLPAYKPSEEGLESFTSHMKDVQSNLFAAKLLAPSHLIRKEVNNIDSSLDLVNQLAEIFWVSKSFINRRLKEILSEGD